MPNIKSNPRRWPSKQGKYSKRAKNVKSSLPNKTGRKNLQEAINTLIEDKKVEEDKDIEKDEKEELINLEEYWCSDEEYERGSFETRCYLSGLRFNKGIAWHSSPWKKTVSKSPGKYCKKYIQQEESKLEKRREKIQSLPAHDKKKRAKIETKLPDHNYGPKALQEALTEEELNLEKYRILNTLQVNEAEQLEIAKLTVGQFNNPAYEVEKANRLTASFFGRVIKKRNLTPCHNIVKDILYKSNFTSPATEYGKSKESVAIKIFEEKTNLNVEASGLYIDIDHGFLGASPDGLIGNTAIIEVKCLYKASQNGWTPQEAAKCKQTCLRINEQNEITLNINHVYYFQIQGQLNITKKDVCYFIVYINDQNDMHIEKIERNEQFWKENMLPKLKKFYLDCVLPEIINSNIPRGLKCVEPS